MLLVFCAFKLGTIHEETEYLKRIDKCVIFNDTPPIQEFYGHGFKKEKLAHTMWVHAKAHDAYIYMDCILEDIK